MESLTAYIPSDRLHALAQGQVLPDRADGAALFADISGFTALTEALARSLGPHRGAEELISQLNQVYDALIAEVDRYGGSVIFFSGDAITCWFDADDARRAIACALAMQQAIGQFATLRVAGAEAVAVAMKVAVASGPVRRFLVGDSDLQQFDVLAGATLHRLASAEQHARKGEVVLDAYSAMRLGALLEITEWRGGRESSDQPDAGAAAAYGVVSRLTAHVEPMPWPALASEPLGEDQLRPWVLPAVYERVRSGQGMFLAELRPATALFLSFDGFDYDDDPAAGAKLDAYVRWVQRVIAHYDGTLLQLTIGDKGSYIYSAFGAPIAHDDDAARAVAVALELRSPPAGLVGAGAARVGLSQGTMRTGAYGGITRRTYGVLGNEVNLAARLMQHAAPGQIVASKRVADATRSQYRIAALGAVNIKGLQNPVPIFELVDRHDNPVRAGRTIGRSPQLPASLVGRADERIRLAECVQQLLRRHPAPLVVIEGEAGIGKSRLIDDMLEQALESGVTCLVGTGDAVERSTPYHAWRPVFSQVFALELLPNQAEARREHVYAFLQFEPELLALAPLLNDLLPLDLSDNELTAQMSGQVRADNTTALLIRLLQYVASSSPLLLVIEDAHWLDSASWSLIQRVSRDLEHVLVVLATRPLAGPVPDEYQQLSNAAETLRLPLEPLPADDIEALLCQRLGVAQLPEQVLDLITQKAEGHPFFSEELAYALRDAGLIIIADDHSGGGYPQCFVAPHVDLATASVPDTVQGVITSRIDRLTPSQQLELKVASVIGRVFAVELLHDVLPIQGDNFRLRDDLANLQRLELTLLHTPEPDLAYLFKHVITQEAAYNLMLFAQRRSLHEAVASWHEQHHANDLAPFYALLAHHWGQAGVHAKTIEYLEKAGQQALSQGAWKEAHTFFSALLDLPAGQPGDIAADAPVVDRRARWIAGLAQSYHGLGQLVETRRYAEQAAALLDRPMPKNTTGAMLALLGQVARQALHRGLPNRLLMPKQPEATQFDLWEAAKLYRDLVTVYYLGNNLPNLLYATVRRLNVVELLAPTGQLVEAYGALEFTCSSLHLYGLAEYYHAKALAADRIVQEPLALAFALDISCLARLATGQWPAIRSDTSRAIQIYRRFGYWQGWGQAMAAITTAERFAGRYTESYHHSEALLQTARSSDNALHELWGIAGKAAIDVLCGRLSEAIAGVQETLALLASNAERGLEIGCYGIMTHACFMLGDIATARQHADTARHMIAESPTPSAIHTYQGYVMSARVYLAIWEAEQSGAQVPPTSGGAKALARQACGFVSRFAFVFPIGQPSRYLYQGLYAWLASQPGAARSAWRKGLAAADKFAMPYEAGQIHYEIGRHAVGAERSQHLTQATEIFERIGAAAELQRALAALNDLAKPAVQA